MERKTHYRDRVRFTLKMKKDYTVLSPSMAPIHFKILKPILQREGYKIEIMENEGPEVLELALKYLHNDMCYPSMLTTGQMLATIMSGKYDPDKVAMIITQSGGGCRDSNYIHLMRKAFEKAGYPNVPFISANIWGLEFNSGANLSPISYLMALAGLIYGDMIMIVSNQVRPYEVNKGETDAMIDKWTTKIGHVKVSLLYMAMQLVVSLGFIYLCPDSVAAHWGYLVGAMIALGVAYVLFKKKYYHLHEEYLASLKK